MGVRAVENSMLFLDIIISLTQISGYSQGGLGFHVAVLKRRVWTHSLKRATLQMISCGRSRTVHLGRRL